MTPAPPSPPAPTPSPADAPDLSVAVAAQWTVRQMILATLTVLGVGLVFLLLYRFYMVVFLFFVAFALTVALEPAIGWLRRRGVRREFGVVLLYVVLAIATAALIAAMAPPLMTQARAVLAELPNYYLSLRVYLLDSRIGLVRGLVNTLPGELSLPMLVASTNGAAEEGNAPTTWTMAWLTARSAFAFVAVFIMAFYWTLEGDVIIRKLLLRTPSERREELRAMVAEVNAKIGGYFRGQVILCVIVGACSIAAFMLIGVPNAIMLGLLMGLFEAIPVVGPTLGAIPAILMTLATAPEMTIWVVGALVAIQVIENNLLVPRIMDESVGVNAVVSMLAITAFGALFGIAGAILAIPLAAILQILLNRLLFATPSAEEAAAGMPATVGVGRSQIGVLRLEARELAHAVRRQARSADFEEDEGEPIADEIEAIAEQLDQYLATVETASGELPAAPPIRGEQPI